MQFFQTEYYGNTIGQWGLALSLILTSFIVGRILYWFLSRWIKKLTVKTETQLDDILIDMLEEPVSALVVALGALYSLRLLDLSESIENGVSNFFAMAFALIVTWAILRLYESFHTNYITDLVANTDTDLDDQLLPVVRTGIRFLVGSLGLIVGLNNAGYEVGAILAGLGIGGLAFALAAQDTVANMFGGIMLFVQQPFQIKDRIQISGIEGYIKEIGLRSSTIETLDGSLILIPNKTFTENPITNLSTAGSYFESTEIRLKDKMTMGEMDTFFESLMTLSDRFDEIDWMAPVINEIGPGYYAVLIYYGVKAWDPKNDVYEVYPLKKNAAKNILMREMATFISEQGLEIAIPLRMSMRAPEPEPKSPNGFPNGNGVHFQPEPAGD